MNRTIDRISDANRMSSRDIDRELWARAHARVHTRAQTVHSFKLNYSK